MSQQPTFHITRQHFVAVINQLQEQYVKDRQRSEAMSEIFNCESGFYDNSALINAIFSFLHEVFPKDDDGHCEIEHYCYCANFGKVGDDYESPEELFDRITTSHIPTHAKKTIVYGDYFSVKATQGDKSMTFTNRVHGEYPVSPEDAFTNSGLDKILIDPKHVSDKPDLTEKLLNHYGDMTWRQFSEHFSKPSPDETH